MTLDESIAWLKDKLIRPALSPFAKCESNTSSVACVKLMDLDRARYILFLDKYGEPVLCVCSRFTAPAREVSYQFIPVENLKDAAAKDSEDWQQAVWYSNCPPVEISDWYRQNGWMPG